MGRAYPAVEAMKIKTTELELTDQDGDPLRLRIPEDRENTVVFDINGQVWCLRHQDLEHFIDTLRSLVE